MLESRDFRNHITIIDGDNKGRVIRAAADNVIDGLVICHGINSSAYAGAGIYADNAITIQNNIIDSNTAGPGGGQWGGGVFLSTTKNYYVRNNIFMRNSATQWGASLFVYQSSNGIIEDNLFTNNLGANTEGNFFMNGSNPAIQKNVFCGNYDFARGAGFEYFGSHGTASNNLIVGNQATNCAAVYIYGITYGIMRNNTIAFNSQSGTSGAVDIKGNGNFDFYNNILANNSGYGIREYLYDDKTSIPNGVLKNNLF